MHGPFTLAWSRRYGPPTYQGIWPVPAAGADMRETLTAGCNEGRRTAWSRRHERIAAKDLANANVVGTNSVDSRSRGAADCCLHRGGCHALAAFRRNPAGTADDTRIGCCRLAVCSVHNAHGRRSCRSPAAAFAAGRSARPFRLSDLPGPRRPAGHSCRCGTFVRADREPACMAIGRRSGASAHNSISVIPLKGSSRADLTPNCACAGRAGAYLGRLRPNTQSIVSRSRRVGVSYAQNIDTHACFPDPRSLDGNCLRPCLPADRRARGRQHRRPGARRRHDRIHRSDRTSLQHYRGHQPDRPEGR